MNYEYEVVLSNGIKFYATSKHRMAWFSADLMDKSRLEFDNCVVNADHVAAVMVWNGRSNFND